MAPVKRAMRRRTFFLINLGCVILASAGLGTILGLNLTLPSAAADPVPHCQPVLIVTPWRTFTVKACDSGLRDPAPGKEWAWTVDGSALKGGAVVFGSQIPRQP